LGLTFHVANANEDEDYAESEMGHEQESDSEDEVNMTTQRPTVGGKEPITWLTNKKGEEYNKNNHKPCSKDQGKIELLEYFISKPGSTELYDSCY
jgi:hypothetical protein